MTYTKVHYDDVESRNGLHMMRDPLGCEHLGFTVTSVEEGWSGMAHDHAESGHEEVYYLVSGAGRLSVGDGIVALQPGDAVRVSPGETRQLHADRNSTFVVVGAP